MNRLQRYLLRELLLSFVLLLMILLGIVGTGLLLQFLHKAPELGLLAMLKALPFVLPEAIPITLPLAFLVACLLTYGRFSADNEFTALRMAGIHPWLGVAPAVMLGAILSLGTLWLNTAVLPWAMLGKKEILRDQIQRLIRHLEEGSSTDVPIGDAFRLSASGREPDGAFTDVYITWEMGEQGDRGDVVTPQSFEARAEKARLWLADDGDALIVELREAESVIGNMRVQQESQTLAIGLDGLVGDSPREETKRTDHMTAEEILYRLARGSPDPSLVRKWQAEYWGRLSLGLAPLFFGLLGAPLGLVSGRSSRAAALIMALLVALPVYYPLLRLGENLAESGALAAPLSMSLGNGVMLGASAWLFWRAVHR